MLVLAKLCAFALEPVVACNCETFPFLVVEFLATRVLSLLAVDFLTAAGNFSLKAKGADLFKRSEKVLSFGERPQNGMGFALLWCFFPR